MVSRGWSWIDEEAEHDYDRLAPRLNALAAEWSQLATQQEERAFRRQAAYEDGERDYCFDSDEELQEHNAWVRERDAVVEVRMEIIEEMLARDGARLMRPYEHWNEDERYMEYMENRY